MNNLWIYGCSFSEPFGLCEEFNCEYDVKNGLRDFKGIDFWGTHLSKKVGMNCIPKSLAGVGWNYISYRIDQDIINWDKNDIIIISPSFFYRIDILEYKNVNNIDKINIYIEDYDRLKSTEEIEEYNRNRWKTKIKTLQYFGYKVYTWSIDICKDCYDVKNLIKSPEGHCSWKDWMDNHTEYWLGSVDDRYQKNDWHFNKEAHKIVAETMYEYIIDN